MPVKVRQLADAWFSPGPPVERNHGARRTENIRERDVLPIERERVQVGSLLAGDWHGHVEKGRAEQPPPALHLLYGFGSL